MELMCSLAVQNEAVIKCLNVIFEEHVLKNGLNEMEKCIDEAIKVCVRAYVHAQAIFIYSRINFRLMEQFFFLLFRTMDFLLSISGSKEIHTNYSLCL